MTTPNELTEETLADDLDRLSEFLSVCQMTGESSRQAMLGQLDGLRKKYGLQPFKYKPSEDILLIAAIEKARLVAGGVGTIEGKRSLIRNILTPHLKKREGSKGNGDTTS